MRIGKLNLTFPIILEWILCLFLCIPIALGSLLYNIVVMNSLFGWERSEEDHSEEVSSIQAHVSRWKAEQRGNKMCTGTPGWKSISLSKTNKTGYYKVPISLDKVVKIDKEKKQVTVEPGLMIGQLTRILVPMGLTIPVVPELSSLSIGGLIAGGGIESSSHKYGLFYDTALSYEVVLPDATAVICSKDHHPDLFYAIPGSYGTLGFITAVTFPLISVTRYTALTYHYCNTASSTKSLILTEGVKHEFIEAFAYTEEDFVVMFGDFTSGPVPTKSINNINRFYKPLFHQHTESVMKKLKDTKGTAFTEYIPTIDYYHRHCRGLFWIMETYFPVLMYKPTFFFLGWMLPLSLRFQVFLLFLVRRLKKQLIIQDYVVPMEEFETFFRQGCEDFKFFPVWICPANVMKTPSMFPKNEIPGPISHVDLGWYGNSGKNCNKPNLLKKFEKLCIDAKGFQGLYADTYLSEEQFNQMFELSLYYKVRNSIGAEAAFPSVYEKISPIARRLKNSRAE